MSLRIWSWKLARGTGAAALAAIAAAGVAPRAGWAQPSPLDTGLWSFPGSASAPGSAISAARALADRWLGEQPFDNPAAPLRGVSGSGVLERLSRQDLRSDNRHFSEQAAFFDFGGAWVAVPVRSVGLVAYAYQPLLRLEDNAFTRGEVGSPVQPASIRSNGTSRELRAGLAASKARGKARAGVAVEWTHRADAYEVSEQSGSPDQGLRHLDFSGDALGGQAGIAWGEDRLERHAFTFGIGARLVPRLSLDGTQRFSLLSGDSVGNVSAQRGSGFEAGASAGYRVQETFRILVGVGGKSGRDWDGLGVKSGAGLQWSVAGEFHDRRDPWTLRFGVGQEHERDVAEYRAGLIGLGLGWKLEHSAFDVGLLHRNMSTADHPTSFDDRLLVSATADF